MFRTLQTNLVVGVLTVVLQRVGSEHGFVCFGFFFFFFGMPRSYTAMTFSCNAFIELLETSCCDGPCLLSWYLEAKAGRPQVPAIQRIDN